MQRVFHFVLYVSFSTLFGCATGKTTTSRTEFNDDLTQYRVVLATKLNDELPTNTNEYELDATAWSAVAPAASVTNELLGRIAQRSRSNRSVSSFSGFRVQLYSGGDRGLARRMVNYLEDTLKTEEPVYLHYEQPNFKVKIGDFLNRVKAHEVHATLREAYPNSLVIRDNITFNLTEYLYGKTEDDVEKTQDEE